MALDATASSPTFNCYVSREDANTIVDDGLYFDSWLNASTVDQERALMFATRLLDEFVQWNGAPVLSTQPLGWPRNYVQRPNRPPGTYFDGADVPDEIKYLTVQYAEALLAEDLFKDNEVGLTSLSVGSIALAFNKRDRKKAMPESLRVMASQFGTVRVGGGSVATLIRR